MTFCTFEPKNISQQSPSCWRLAWLSERNQKQQSVFPGVYEPGFRPSIYKSESLLAVKPSWISPTETSTWWWASRGPSHGNRWHWVPCRSGWHEPAPRGAAPAAWHVWLGQWHLGRRGSGHLPGPVCSAGQRLWRRHTANLDLGTRWHVSGCPLQINLSLPNIISSCTVYWLYNQWNEAVNVQMPRLCSIIRNVFFFFKKKLQNASGVKNLTHI